MLNIAVILLSIAVILTDIGILRLSWSLHNAELEIAYLKNNLSWVMRNFEKK